jgi:hypothetical protein
MTQSGKYMQSENIRYILTNLTKLADKRREKMDFVTASRIK